MHRAPKTCRVSRLRGVVRGVALALAASACLLAAQTSFANDDHVAEPGAERHVPSVAVHAVLAKLDSDYGVFDLCWSTHTDLARSELASAIVEQTARADRLYIVALPGISSSRRGLGMSPLRDMEGHAIDRGILRRHTVSYERDLDAALAEVLDRVRDERPDVMLTVFAFQPRVDRGGSLTVNYPGIAERIDFLLQTARTVAHDAAGAARAGDRDVEFAPALIEWAAEGDKGLLRLSPERGWLLRAPASSELLDVTDRGEAADQPAPTPEPAPDSERPEKPAEDSTPEGKPSQPKDSSVAHEGTGAPPTADDDEPEGGPNDHDKRKHDRNWNELRVSTHAFRDDGAFDEPESGDMGDIPLSGDAFRVSRWAEASLSRTEHDRRVTVAIRGFNGDKSDPAGLGRPRGGWRSTNDNEAIAWFTSRVRLFADVGVRRIVFKNPAGARLRYPPNALRWIPDSRKRKLRHAMDLLRSEYPGLDIGIYVGSGIDPTPDDIDYSNDHVIAPDFSDPDDRETMLAYYRDVPDWGFDFLYIDNISGTGGGKEPRRWLAWLESEIGIPTYGEAVPTTRDPSKYPPGPWGVHFGADREEADAWRYMALREFVETRSITTDGTREHYVGFTGRDEDWRSEDNERRRPIIDDFIQRGFVPFIYARGPQDAEIEIARYAVERFAEYEAAERGNDAPPSTE